jgi:hypothetical protein
MNTLDKKCSVATLMLFVALAAGCAANLGRIVDDVVRPVVDSKGHGTLLAFTERGDHIEIGSIGAAYGQTRRSGAPVSIAIIEDDWGTLEILTTAQDQTEISEALDIGISSEPRWLAGAASSLGDVLEMMPGLSQKMHIKAAIVPDNIAYKFEVKTRSDSSPLEMAILSAVDLGAKQPAAEWYSRMLRVAAHELLHVHYYLNRLKPSNDYNEETAASLMEFCAVALYARALDAEVTLDVTLRDSELYLTQDVPPAFRPTDEGIYGGPATAAGSHIAHAVIIAKIGNSFSFNDSRVDDLLLPYCRNLGKGQIPDFVSGETF